MMTTLVVQGAEIFEGRAYYIGDPHHHTCISGDGFCTELTDPTAPNYSELGSVEEIFDVAVANGLDWLAITDHINGPHGATQENWEWGQRLVLEHDEEATGLVVVPAAEYYLSGTVPYHGPEHRNLYFFADNDVLSTLQWSELLSAFQDGTTTVSCGDLSDWLDTMSSSYGDLLLIPHHPANLAPTNWGCFDEDYTPAVEVYSGWGSAIGGPLGDWETPIWKPEPTATANVAMYSRGYAHRFGFWGGSDNHNTVPGELCGPTAYRRVNTGGLTVAVLDEAEDWTRASLHDAIIDRRTYSTSGPLVPVVVELYADGALIGELGDEIQPYGGEDVELEVRIPSEYDPAVLGVIIVTEDYVLQPTSDTPGTWSQTLNGNAMPPWAYVAVKLDGQIWYGSDTCDDGGDDAYEWLWLSPTWIDQEDHDWDADGISWADGDCDDDDSTVFPHATEIWYDGVDQDCDHRSDYDADRDGHEASGFGGDDCDDADRAIHPDAIETWYDGVDQDCDGGSDFDQDHDGHDTDAHGGDDCDDTDRAIHPDAAETWYDGVDQDCDGESDFDQDRDGHDTDAHGGDDCDDTDSIISPSAAEIWYDGVDQDCDGWPDYDADRDGHEASVFGGADCDDSDGAISPSAIETWYDGVDQDCDGWPDFDQDRDGHDTDAYGGSTNNSDCDDTDSAVNSSATETWYDGVDQDCDGWPDFDQDRDGFAWDGFGGLDCDDGDIAVHPHAMEVWYDGVDQDCNRASDYDADGDGHEALAFGGDDCDDTDAFTFPGSRELWYDGVDQDCDGASDFDQDRDGHDTDAYGCDDCDDCDDTDDAIHPDADELWYDGIDQDCSGGSDYDADSDGWEQGRDCDDQDPSAWPGAPGWTVTCDELTRTTPTGCSHRGQRLPRGLSLAVLGLLGLSLRRRVWPDPTPERE